jgi:hypothetical protein
MKLKEYIKGADFETIWSIIVKWYPNQSKSREGYEKIWNELQTLEPIEDHTHINMRISVTYVPPEPEFEAEEWYDVDGHSDEEDLNWALEYTEWEKWLGYNIDWETYNRYDREFVIAHILYEMSWAGFDQKSIQERGKELNSEADEIGAGFEEALVNGEIEQITWEELFNENLQEDKNI